MKTSLGARACAVIAALLPAVASAIDFEITPAVQAELDRQKAVIATWAADPVIVAAVRAQNRKGPMAGVDNARWKTMRRSDPAVRQFQTNEAGQFLREHQRQSGGAITEVFLNAAKGEKVAFGEKTTSYIHAGSAKHDVPFGTGKPWQGEAEFDESTQTYAVQVSVPVLDGGRPIGSLVAGVNVSHLRQASR
jgi:hypothetical protein